MSSGRNQQNQNQPQHSWIKTAATLAVGAVAGAALAGAAYFAATEDDRQQEERRQILAQQRAAPINRSTIDDDEKEEKVEGVVKVCEICFVDFEEIKSHDVHIMATPCGHVFCRICIEETLLRRPSCPHCRQPCEIDELQRLYL